MRRAFATLCLLLASTTHASEVRWHCVLSAELTRLHCAVASTAAHAVLAGAADADAPGAAEPATAPPTPVVEVRGTRFPLDTRGTWTVDLWTPPSDGAFVEQLARATICYRTPRCTVKVDLRPLSQHDARASTR